MVSVERALEGPHAAGELGTRVLYCKEHSAWAKPMAGDQRAQHPALLILVEACLKHAFVILVVELGVCRVVVRQYAEAALLFADTLLSSCERTVMNSADKMSVCRTLR